MKKIYLVHCWDGTSKDGWYPWLVEILSSKDIEVNLLDMPNTHTPIMKDWINYLDKNIDSLDSNTYFIGHSIGCQTILRYLEKKEITKIGGILLVTPWLDLLPYAVNDSESYKIAYPWIHTSLNFEKIKQFTNNIHAIFSDNDYFVDINQSKEFENKLGTRNKIVHKKGHMSGEDGVNESYEILESIAEILDLELLDEVDENGNLTGRFYPKDYIHKNLLWHRVVSLWIQNNDGNILVQKRSKHKKSDPGKWSITAGHIDHGEEAEKALLREVKEELGIQITEPLTFMLIDKNSGTEEKKKADFNYYYYLKKDIDLSTCKLQVEEVEEVNFISLEDFKNNKYPDSDEGLYANHPLKEQFIKYLEEKI